MTPDVHLHFAQLKCDTIPADFSWRQTMPTRSRDILTWPEWSMHRAYFKSMGYTDYDIERPMIGIANSWNRVVPGHYNLNLVSEYVKQGIFQAGGTPVEFGVIAACDGIAQGHEGMHYILPTRDLIANDIELMVQAHRLDAVVLLCSCDKIVPGMLMAAARLDLPAIVVAGGPMRGYAQYSLDAAVDAGIDAITILEGESVISASPDPCVNCGPCIDACPVNLQIQLIGRYAEFHLFDRTVELGIEECIECGICAAVCTARRPLLQLVRRLGTLQSRDLLRPAYRRLRAELPSVPHDQRAGSVPPLCSDCPRWLAASIG